MNEDLTDLDFYKQAYNLIYDWLSDEEKIQFYIEIIDEKSKYNSENYLTQLLRLIHFIQIKYVNLEKYVDEIFINFLNISEYKPSVRIEDIIYLTEAASYSILNIQKNIKEQNLTTEFNILLEKTGLLKNYEQYKESLRIREEIEYGLK